MSPFQDDLIFHAEFNSLLDDGRIAVSRRYASSPRKPTEGEWVLLKDDEGNRYRARVERVTARAVHVVADLDSWQPGASIHRTDEPPLAHLEPDVEVTAPESQPEPEFALAG